MKIDYEYNWVPILLSLFSECPRCVESRDGLTCCGKGGSWRGKCGPVGDMRFEHTWLDGLAACVGVTTQNVVTAQTRPQNGKVYITSVKQQ